MNTVGWAKYGVYIAGLIGMPFGNIIRGCINGVPFVDIGSCFRTGCGSFDEQQLDLTGSSAIVSTVGLVTTSFGCTFVFELQHDPPFFGAAGIVTTGLGVVLG